MSIKYFFRTTFKKGTKSPKKGLKGTTLYTIFPKSPFKGPVPLKRDLLSNTADDPHDSVWTIYLKERPTDRPDVILLVTGTRHFLFDLNTISV